MAYRARVVTTWKQVNGRNCMKVAADHPFPSVSYSDVTGQPDANLLPDPNALVVEVEPLTDAQLTALEADSTALVLWSEVI